MPSRLRRKLRPRPARRQAGIRQNSARAGICLPGRSTGTWTSPSRPFKRKVRTSMPSEPSLLFTMKTRTTNFFSRWQQEAGQGNADYSQNQQDQALHDRGQRHPDGRQEHRPFGDPPGQREKGWHQHLADGIKANSKEKTS